MNKLSIKDIFGWSKEKCLDFLEEDIFSSQVSKKYEKLSELKNVIIILCYNHELLIEEDSEFVKTFRYDFVMSKQPKTYKNFVSLSKEKRKYTNTYTLTIGDRGENHAGMQVIGDFAEKGLSFSDLKKVQQYFNEREFQTEMIKLHNLVSKDDSFGNFIKFENNFVERHFF